jgi:hypothetical protein
MAKKKYQAPTNIAWGENCNAPAGEIVELTDQQAHDLQTRHPVPVIRPASEAAKPMRRVTAADLFPVSRGVGNA